MWTYKHRTCSYKDAMCTYKDAMYTYKDAMWTYKHRTCTYKDAMCTYKDAMWAYKHTCGHINIVHVHIKMLCAHTNIHVHFSLTKSTYLFLVLTGHHSALTEIFLIVPVI